jgi:hypothetical protein
LLSFNKERYLTINNFCGRMIQGQYTGKLIEGVREGVGKLEWSNGDIYEGRDAVVSTCSCRLPVKLLVTAGEFKNGLRHGKGVFYENNRTRKYEGTWSMSMKEGACKPNKYGIDSHNAEVTLHISHRKWNRILWQWRFLHWRVYA